VRSDIRNEVEIVWLDPSAKGFAFLREKWFSSNTRSRAPRKEHGAVAYAVLGPNERRERGCRFERRFWLLHDNDPGSYVNAAGLVDCSPIEGVEPGSIAAGQESVSADPGLKANPRPWSA
jgi:hypothetical protein